MTLNHHHLSRQRVGNTELPRKTGCSVRRAIGESSVARSGIALSTATATYLFSLNAAAARKDVQARPDEATVESCVRSGEGSHRVIRAGAERQRVSSPVRPRSFSSTFSGLCAAHPRMGFFTRNPNWSLT